MTFTVRTLLDGVTKSISCDRCRDSEQSRLDTVLQRFKREHDCDAPTTTTGRPAA